MSDLIKKAAGLFFTVEDNDADDKKTAKEVIKDTPKNPTDSYPGNDSSDITIPDDGSIKKFQAYFKKLYDTSNLQGPDFYEFNNMSEAMGSVIADEVKYPAVYAGFAGLVTKEKLITSAETYLNLIQNDVNEFEQSLQIALRTKVADRKNQIDIKAGKIIDLQEQIAKLNQEIIDLNKLAKEEENRLSSERLAYYQESEGLTKKIQTGLQKIKLYIK